MHGKGDVLQHQQDVRHGDREQDQVDRVAPHLLVAEDNYVEKVKKCAKHADDNRQVAVSSRVRIL